MKWNVEYTDEFEQWWTSLTEQEQDDVAARVGLLEEYGPKLPFPYCSGVESSRHEHMRELRIQHAGDPYRVLYAFDPIRNALLLIGGNKKGNDRWYEQNVPRADQIYDRHLETLGREGLLT